MPNRIVRDAILHSERYHSIGVEAKVLFFELLLNADDYGLIPLRPVYLRMHCPVCSGKDNAWIERVITELLDVDLIRPYDYEQARYAFIPRFGNSPRAVKPKWPLPPAGLDGNEIKLLMDELLLRRRASAKHLHSGCTASAPETETETDIPPLPPNRGQAGFAKFWSAYPKKRSKGDAVKAWNQLKPNEQLQEAILRGVERAKTSVDWRKDGGQFTPYPARWLRARAWEDVLTVVVSNPDPPKPQLAL